MGFVHIQAIHTQLLKRDHIVLLFFGLELLQAGFQLLAGTLQLLDGELLAVIAFQLPDTV